MKKSLIKAAAFVSVAAMVFFIAFSCSKQSDTTELKPNTKMNEHDRSTGGVANRLGDDHPFKPTVGAPIPKETSKRWVENYNRANGTNESTVYVLQRADLEAILADPSCVGISMHYALDEKGKMHIIPVGVSDKGKLMQTVAVNTLSGQISWGMAQQWIANDKGPIDSRFFGRDTFGRLFSEPSCSAIWAMFALDDEGKSQLVLSRKQDGQVSPSFEAPGDDEDRTSVLCPPDCP